MTLKLEGEDLLAEVSDDRQGFGPGTVPRVGQSSMRERANSSAGNWRSRANQGRVPVCGCGSHCHREWQ